MQVLSLRRPPGRGHIWQPVTGNVDAADPSLPEAALRELAEETGIKDRIDLVDTGIDFRFLKDGREVVERLIGVETAGPAAVTLSGEHVDYAWLAPEDAAGRFKWEIHKEGVRRVIDAVSDERPTL